MFIIKLMGGLSGAPSRAVGMMFKIKQETNNANNPEKLIIW
ncbi:MAG TPA: hypothetical protein VIK78_16100 [Ruminiclostridium sp.]